MNKNNFINKIIRFCITLLIGFTIKTEIEREYPGIKKKLPIWLRWL